MTTTKSLSYAAYQSINAPETAEQWLWLLTIEHADFAQPIWLARNWRPVTSRGITFTPFPFAPEIAQEDPSRPARLSIRIGNVSRVITLKLEEVQGSDTIPKVTLEVVLASQPSVVEYTLSEFEFRNVSYDSRVLQAVLEVEDFFTSPYPYLRRTPKIAPGSHRKTT